MNHRRSKVGGIKSEASGHVRCSLFNYEFNWITHYGRLSVNNNRKQYTQEKLTKITSRMKFATTFIWLRLILECELLCKSIETTVSGINTESNKYGVK